MSRFTSLVALGGLAMVAAVSAPACLVREVSIEQPTTKISFEARVPQPAVDKVDLLVVVDNSSSMADKQKILADALPDLLHGLVQPKCVDAITRTPVGATADTSKPDGQQCPAGSEPAFTPVTDMHIGVISTSLGGFGLPTCAPASDRFNDDRAHLLARGEEGPVAAAGDLHFLAWYPDVASNTDKKRHPDPPVPKTKTLDALDAAFRDLVVGVGDNGCGIEAQLESAYRFLVQPDPPLSTSIDAKVPVAHDVDRELLRQRAAFLRPDSLVAVLMLTDEDDASLDPWSFRGSAWHFLEAAPLPHGTAACASEPASTTCTSCAFAPDDPSCGANGGTFTALEDDLNVRFHRMKPRFGVDPRYPLRRYIDGFREKNVPRRDGEHDASGAYVGKAACTNPLFAASLPAGEAGDELCKLPLGPRTPDLVYFAVIGGVPPALLPDPKDPGATVDWTRILGRDPAKLDTRGIDPHMIDSTTPRPGLATGPGLPDPIHGREWTTGGKDLQLACAFDLYERTPAGVAKVERTCDGQSCDCDGTKDIPLCKESDRRIQIRGKAYPTLRELTVAKELGDHGIPASLCATQLTEPERDDYGYRPAMRAILTRFETGLQACLPRALVRDAEDGPVPCLVVATLQDEGPDTDCARFGLAPPKPALLAQMRERIAENEGPAAARHPICELPQVTVPRGQTCRHDDERMGFCYAEDAPGVRCAHSLQFTKQVDQLVGARFSLQCIQVSD